MRGIGVKVIREGSAYFGLRGYVETVLARGHSGYRLLGVRLPGERRAIFFDERSLEILPDAGDGARAT